MLKRLKTITSYAGHARFLARVEGTGEYLARCDVADISSPYRYSPSIEILEHQFDGKKVVIFETSHRRYEVFEVPAQMRRFTSDDAATDYHVRMAA